MKTFFSEPMVIAAMLAVVCGGGLEAQQNTSSLPRTGCFRGQPLPECQSFWIYELRGSLPLVNTTRSARTEDVDPEQFFGLGEGSRREFGQAAAVEVGYAWNRSEDTALGGSLSIEVGERTRYFVRARVRRWVGTNGISVEALPGFFTHADNGVSPGSSSVGYTLGLRMNVLDQGFLGVRYDGFYIAEHTRQFGSGISIDPGGLQHGVHAVAGLSSVPALWGSGAVGIGFLALVGILAASSS